MSISRHAAIVITCWYLISPTMSYAAKPTTITFEQEGITNDSVDYAIYIVKCSDGRKQPMTSWDKRRKWCEGRNSQENCHKKQITSAKAACK